MPGFDPATAIATEAQTQGVDPSLALAIAQQGEGYGRFLSPTATSPAGAQGTMQLMPHTAAALGVDPTNPAQNVRGGVRYIKQLSDQFGGDPALVAAAYNAGPGAVAAHKGVPPFPETQAYVSRVTGALPSTVSPQQLSEATAAYASMQANPNTQPATGAGPPTVGVAPLPPIPGAQSAGDQTGGMVPPGELAAAQAAYAKAQGLPAPDTTSPTLASVGAQVGRGALTGYQGIENAAFDLFTNPTNDLTRLANLGLTLTGRPTLPVQPGVANALTPQPVQQWMNQPPQNAPERFGRIAGEMLPGALVPGGEIGLAGRAANVALPALGSFGAGELGRTLGASPQAQALLTTGGALLGGGLAAKTAGLGVGEEGPTVAGIDPANPVAPRVAAQAAQYVQGKLGAEDPQMTAAAQSGKPVMLAEMMGQPGKLALKVAAGKAPAIAGDLTHAIQERAASLQPNIADAFGQAAGIDPLSAAGDFAASIAAKRAAVAPKYGDIFASGEPVMNPDLAAIAQRPAVQKAMGQAAASLRNAGTDPTAVGIKIDPQTGQPVMTTPQPPALPPGTEGLGQAAQSQIAAKMGLQAPEPAPVTESQPTLQGWDLTKKALANMVTRDPITGQVVRSGPEGIFNGDLQTASSDLTGALRTARPDYAAVLDQAGDYMSQRAAFDKGASHLFNDKVSAAQGKDYFDSLSPAEQDAYRSGMASSISSKEQALNLTPKSLAKPVVRGKLDYALPSGADGFLTDVDYLTAMNSNGSFMQPGQGSMTQPATAEAAAQDQASHGGLVQDIMHHAGSDLVTGLGAGVLEHFMHGGSLHEAALTAGGMALGSAALRSRAAIGSAMQDFGKAPGFHAEVGRLLMSRMTPEQLNDYVKQTMRLPGADVGQRTAVPLSQSIYAPSLSAPSAQPQGALSPP